MTFSCSTELNDIPGALVVLLLVPCVNHQPSMFSVSSPDQGNGPAGVAGKPGLGEAVVDVGGHPGSLALLWSLCYHWPVNLPTQGSLSTSTHLPPMPNSGPSILLRLHRKKLGHWPLPCSHLSPDLWSLPRPPAPFRLPPLCQPTAILLLGSWAVLFGLFFLMWDIPRFPRNTLNKNYMSPVLILLSIPAGGKSCNAQDNRGQTNWKRLGE